MPPDDRVRLLHMRDAGREAIGFATGRTRGDLDTDRQLLLSIVKDIEIVGEAASRVGPESRARFPEIAWVAVVAMRNRLIHAYFDINHASTITGHFPPGSRRCRSGATP